MTDFVNNVVSQVRKKDSGLFMQSGGTLKNGKKREYTLRKRSKKWNVSEKLRGGATTNDKKELDVGKIIDNYVRAGGDTPPLELITRARNDPNQIFNTYLTDTYSKSEDAKKSKQVIKNEISDLEKKPNKSVADTNKLAELRKHKNFRNALSYQYGTVKKGIFGNMSIKTYPRAAIKELFAAGIITQEQRGEMLGQINSAGYSPPPNQPTPVTTNTNKEVVDEDVPLVTGGTKTAEEVAGEVFDKLSGKLASMDDQFANKIVDAVYYIIKHNHKSILESLVKILTSKGVTDGLNGASTKILICSGLYNNSTIFGNALTETFMTDVYKGKQTYKPPKIGDLLDNLSDDSFIEQFTNMLISKLKQDAFHGKQ